MVVVGGGRGAKAVVVAEQHAANTKKDSKSLRQEIMMRFRERRILVFELLECEDRERVYDRGWGNETVMTMMIGTICRKGQGGGERELKNQSAAEQHRAML